MPITIKDAINLLPASIRDARGQHFVRIVYWFCCEPEHLNAADFPLSLIPYKLTQIGLGEIAGLSARLTAANQRLLLAEADSLQKLAGTPRSIKRVLEIFGYPGAVIDENPTINGVKRWGEFGIVMQQQFSYSEVETIVNALKPPSRKMIFIRFVNAIVLNGSQLLNGSTILEGLIGPEPPPLPWQDASTALTPSPALTPVPDFTPSSNNSALATFNPQMQALLNQLAFEDSALIALATRVNNLNNQLNALGGGSISTQLSAINSGITTLTNSNQILLNAINQAATPISNLTTKTNSLETQSNAITAESNARQLDSTVQRKNTTLDGLAALASTSPFPADKVVSTAGTNGAIIFENAPVLSSYMPEISNLELRQPSGTNAGNYTVADAWAAMPLTLQSNDTSLVVAVTTTRFRIPQGIYLISYTWQGCGCLGFGGRIWNATNGSALEQGSPGLTVTGGGNIGDTWSAEGCMFAAFSITVATLDIEFQFRAKNLHPNGAGLTGGQSTNNANEQVYQRATIMKISN